MEKVSQLKQFLEKSPLDSFLRHALALEYIKAGNDIEARQTFEQILAHEPGYVGSYYHLGKLLERMGENKLAENWYEKGMAAAKLAGDSHSYNELQAAYEDLVF